MTDAKNGWHLLTGKIQIPYSATCINRDIGNKDLKKGGNLNTNVVCFG